MLYRSLFPNDLFSQFDRLQREFASTFDLSPSIRGLGRDGYPGINVGATATSVDVYAFAPGIEPASMAVDIDRGVLSITGERKRSSPQESDAKTTVHATERFAGRFRRVVSLPDDIDADGVQARYVDGVVHVSVPRKPAAQPRRITVN